MLGVIEDAEVLLFICGFLEPKELSRLAGVSRGFGRKREWAALEGGEPEMRSLVEESARRWVLARRPPQAGWQSWLRRMHGVSTCQLTRAQDHIALSEDGAVATVVTPIPPGSGTRAAACGTVLRAGRHFAVFTVQKERSRNVLLVGVVAAGFGDNVVHGEVPYTTKFGDNVAKQLPWTGCGDVHAESVQGHCFFSTRYGRRYPNAGGGAWHGKQGAANGDRIGLVSAAHAAWTLGL